MAYHTCPARISGSKREALSLEAALGPDESDVLTVFNGSWPRARKQSRSEQTTIWDSHFWEREAPPSYSNHKAAAVDLEAVAMLEAMSAAVGTETPSAGAFDEVAALEALTAQAALSSPDDEAAELHALAMLEAVAPDPEAAASLDTDELLGLLQPDEGAPIEAEELLLLPELPELPELLPDELAARLHRLGVVTPTLPAAHGTPPPPPQPLPARRSSNGATRTEWSAAEDEAIRVGVAAHGPKWRVIAAALPGRSDDAVRNRWCRLKDAACEPAAAGGCGGGSLNEGLLLPPVDAAPPKVRRGSGGSGSRDDEAGDGARRVERVSWTRAEDEVILRRVGDWGHKWYRIGRELPGRTDHAIRNRYHRLQTMAAENYQRPPAHPQDVLDMRMTVPAVPFVQLVGA